MRASVVTGWTLVSTGTADVAVAEREALGTSARVAAWPAEDIGTALTAVDIELAGWRSRRAGFATIPSSPGSTAAGAAFIS